jgi:hypothetical protein
VRQQKGKKVWNENFKPFSFYNTGNIEMRNRTLKGELLAWFNNETSADKVKDIFSRL